MTLNAVHEENFPHSGDRDKNKFRCLAIGKTELSTVEHRTQKSSKQTHNLIFIHHELIQ